jgi:hypothetical protein
MPNLTIIVKVFCDTDALLYVSEAISASGGSIHMDLAVSLPEINLNNNIWKALGNQFEMHSISKINQIAGEVVNVKPSFKILLIRIHSRGFKKN